MDFILDCVQKMTEPVQSEGQNASIETESLDSVSTATTQPQWKGPLVKDPADHLQSGLKNS
jgi:hypothetical protein